MGKKTTFFLSILNIFFQVSLAQVTVDTAVSFGTTKAIIDIAPKLNQKVEKEGFNKLRRHKHKYDIFNLKSTDNTQLAEGTLLNQPPKVKWEGLDFSSQLVTPPDPSGAAGPNHYVHMVNVAFQVYDKQGNSLFGPTSLSTIFPGSEDDGDPIVLYDKFADRWFISQFQVANNEILIAVSKTPSPLGEWNYYTFAFDEFPDYPKFSIWKNGYYMTANMSTQNAVCFNRDELLAGNPTARRISFDIPDVSVNGFFGALPAHFDGTSLSDCPEVCNIFYFQDDGWTGIQDELKIWDIDVDWDNPQSSTIILKETIKVNAFDSEFTTDWDDITQPNTSSKLDAVPGALMFMAPMRSFDTYKSVVLCHTVDIDPLATIRSGIRWYELREDQGTWEVYQQGTYAPDDGQSRWMGSIGMDESGNIGMAFSISGPSTFPSIAYTGRRSSDELGQMTLKEKIAFDGSGVQTGTNRFGDYAHLVMDPSNNSTFWYTGEFINIQGWKTGVFSFDIPPIFNADVGLADILEPLDGELSNAEIIKVKLQNFGINAQSNFDVRLDINGTVITETFTQTLDSGSVMDFTFTTPFDMGNIGAYNFIVSTNLPGDEYTPNDTLTKVINHIEPFDVGVRRVVAPRQGDLTGAESVVLEVKNYGYSPISKIPIVFQINDVTILDTIRDTINSLQVLNYELIETIDLSVEGTYKLVAFTTLPQDPIKDNDTAKVELEKKLCIPRSNCAFGDAIEYFELGTIQNTSSCGQDGYSDFTNLETTLIKGLENILKIESNEDFQNLTLWIDYNNNFLFEESEIILKNFEYDISGETTFIIPSSAIEGKHLLRVRTNYDASSANPCQDYPFGETEDYMVDIQKSVGTTSPSVKVLHFYDPINEMLNYDIKGDGNETYNLYMYNSLGQMVNSQKQINSKGTISMSNLSNGPYLISFTINNSELVIYSFLINKI